MKTTLKTGSTILKNIKSKSGSNNYQQKIEMLLRKAQEHKEFKDTENRIGGSKKEKAAYKRVQLADLATIEQNVVNAVQLVTKDRVYPKVDIERQQATGVSAGAAYLKVQMRRNFSVAPPNSADGRKIYVAYTQHLQDIFERVKTVEEFIKIQRNEFISIRNDKDYYRLVEIFGRRFTKFISRHWNSKAKGYEESDNWAWANKKKLHRKNESELKVNTYPPLSFINRKGGIKITDGDITVKSIRQKFGFKEVEFGNALNNKESRELIRHFLCAMADLGDILNMNVVQLNQLGNLSIAFASRGSGNAGAHYESLSKAINLTKQRGGGAVAHEYGHYIDNLLPKVDNVNYEYKNYGSDGKGVNRKNVRNIINDKVQKAIDNIFHYIYRLKLPGSTLNVEDKIVRKLIKASDALYEISDEVKGEDIEHYFSSYIQIYTRFGYLDELATRDFKVLGYIVKKFGFEQYEFPFKSGRSAYYSHSLEMNSDYPPKYHPNPNPGTVVVVVGLPVAANELISARPDIEGPV